MGIGKLLYINLLISLCCLAACTGKMKQISSEQKAVEQGTLPGYYGQWLYIKTAGTNTLPEMSKYNWDQGAKRAISDVLLNVYELGPTNVGGRIRAMIVDKANPN